MSQNLAGLRLSIYTHPGSSQCIVPLLLLTDQMVASLDHYHRVVKAQTAAWDCQAVVINFHWKLFLNHKSPGQNKHVPLPPFAKDVLFVLVHPSTEDVTPVLVTLSLLGCLAFSIKPCLSL